jgi:hypothetical protein
VLSPAYVKAALVRLREAPPAEPEDKGEEPEEAVGRGPRLTRETLEAEQRDEDAIR